MGIKSPILDGLSRGPREERPDPLLLSVAKFRGEGIEPAILGLNAESQAIVNRLAIYDKEGAAQADAAAH